MIGFLHHISNFQILNLSICQICALSPFSKSIAHSKTSHKTRQNETKPQKKINQLLQKSLVSIKNINFNST